MGKRRDPAQIARDRLKISEWYLQGWLQVDIAEELKIDQSTVSRDLKALHKLWLESSLVNIDEKRAKELAKVDYLEWVYWDAWERSKQDAETVTAKDRGIVQTGAKQGKGKQGGGAQQRERTIQRKGQVGDPTFLKGVQWCIDKRCQILGIEAPDRIEFPGGIDVRMFSFEEWKAKREERLNQVAHMPDPGIEGSGHEPADG